MARHAAYFPVDKESLNYLRLTGRSEEQIELVEAYCREQGLFHDENTPEAQYSELLALDLSTRRAEYRGTEASAGSRAALAGWQSFEEALPSLIKAKIWSENFGARPHLRWLH